MNSTISLSSLSSPAHVDDELTYRWDDTGKSKSRTTTVLGACDAVLRDLKAQGRHPAPASDITPQQAFRLAGADEWDRYRTQFRTPPSKQAAE